MQLLTAHFVVFNQLWNVGVHSAETETWADLSHTYSSAQLPLFQGRAEGEDPLAKAVFNRIHADESILLNWTVELSWVWSQIVVSSVILFQTHQTKNQNWIEGLSQTQTTMPCPGKVPAILPSLIWIDYHPGSSFLNTWGSHSSLFIWSLHCQTSAEIGIKSRGMHQACLFSSSYAAGDWAPWPCKSLESCFMAFFMAWWCFFSRHLSLLWHASSGHTGTFWNCTFPGFCICHLLKTKQCLNHYKASLEGEVPLGCAAEKNHSSKSIFFWIILICAKDSSPSKADRYLWPCQGGPSVLKLWMLQSRPPGWHGHTLLSSLAHAISPRGLEWQDQAPREGFGSCSNKEIWGWPEQGGFPGAHSAAWGSTVSSGCLFIDWLIYCSFGMLNPAGAPVGAGSKPYRPVMGGNGGFWGLGFPSGFFLLSTAPADADVTWGLWLL